MRVRGLIELMTYIWLAGEWRWLLTMTVIGSGLFLLWFGYKMVLFKLAWPIGKLKINNRKEKRRWAVEEEICIPFSGRLMPITQVPDPIFSEKMVGDGFAIEPVRGEIFSPISGKITQIYANGDAVTFRSKDQRNIILHIGVDTSNLKGQGICFEITEGADVQAGQRLGKVDLDYVIPRVSSIISPVVFPDLKECERIVLRRSGRVEAGEKGIIVIEKEEI